MNSGRLESDDIYSWTPWTRTTRVLGTDLGSEIETPHETREKPVRPDRPWCIYPYSLFVSVLPTHDKFYHPYHGYYYWSYFWLWKVLDVLWDSLIILSRIWKNWKKILNNEMNIYNASIGTNIIFGCKYFRSDSEQCWYFWKAADFS